MTMPDEMLLVHGTTIAFGSQAVLLRGKPGSGKSSLALMLMETPGNGLANILLTAGLVADDQTRLISRGGKLLASAPPGLQGLLEVRGLGIMTVDPVAEAELALVVDLLSHREISRLPEPAETTTVLLGKNLPRIFVDASLPQTPARLRTAFVRRVLQA